MLTIPPILRELHRRTKASLRNSLYEKTVVIVAVVVLHFFNMDEQVADSALPGLAAFSRILRGFTSALHRMTVSVKSP